MQSFSFRSVVLPEISLNEKSVTKESPSQSDTQSAQFDAEEPQLCSGNTGFRHPGNIQQYTTFFFFWGGGAKPSKKSAPNLIQFQFVMPAIIKDFFMFTASNDHN